MPVIIATFGCLAPDDIHDASILTSIKKIHAARKRVAEIFVIRDLIEALRRLYRVYLPSCSRLAAGLDNFTSNGSVAHEPRQPYPYSYHGPLCLNETTRPVMSAP